MKKRKRRRKVWKIVLAVLAAVILLAVIAVFGFRKKLLNVLEMSLGRPLIVAIRNFLIKVP